MIIFKIQGYPLTKLGCTTFKPIDGKKSKKTWSIEGRKRKIKESMVNKKHELKSKSKYFNNCNKWK